MYNSLPILSKLKDSDFINVDLNGIEPEQWLFLYLNFYSTSKNNLFILDSEVKAEMTFDIIKSKQQNTLFYPELGSDIYEGRLSSEFNLLQRFNCISKILNSNEQYNIVTTPKALSLITPSLEFFKNDNFQISVSDIYNHNELSAKLTSLGFRRTPTTEEPGTFAAKGEIFDIYPFNSKPVRLIFFDDMIEEIREIDPTTLKSKPNCNIDSIQFSKTQHNLLDQDYVNRFLNNFPRPKLNETNKYEFRRHISKCLRNKYFFDDYPSYLGYFLENHNTLLGFLKNTNVHFFNMHKAIEEIEIYKNTLIENQKVYQESSEDIKADYDQVFDFSCLNEMGCVQINEVELTNNLDKDQFKDSFNLNITPFLATFKIDPTGQNKVIDISNSIKKLVSQNKNIYIVWNQEKHKDEIQYNLSQVGISGVLSKIEFIQGQLSQGFVYGSQDLIVISSNDFFKKSIKKVKNTKTNFESDLFADQLSTLNIGDYLIHKDYGVGKYLGLDTLTLGDTTSDYIIIEYKDNDKVYVPVYRLNLIQKYANKETKPTLSNLKTQKFDAIKAKAKQSVKKLAFDLLELHAKRELQKGYKFSESDHDYENFALSFGFQETADQASAINDVLNDMMSEKPMDRLVCGDVGFGKTEVAMRAAFKAVCDNKQVAVLVPTTVLSFQHYNSFKERFKDFPVNIEFISRFKTTKQVNEILQKLAEGKIDILIGTHKILSNSVKFKDLGLLIIDEEQRFGVGHKEKMKLLKENVDTLTLTATPIPRTLQMSFLGIKDLSIIKTAPPKRQTIKSYIIKEDNQTLKLAIEKELSRAGQVFIVHNRVNDIEIFAGKVQKLVPSARIVFAHGQMGEKELEKRITDFYGYKYDVLISTTIIESGIDIPKANTMIIDRADTFGLSQLHQLRGRIGRSDKKAYAYFIIPSFHNISEIASKRLKALQTYAELGSGFNLASSDLEIRGSGDILGAEQSGHIGNIGLELYMELLQDAINEIKGKPIQRNKNIEFMTPFNGYIPTSYIENSSERLRFYKKLSNSSTENQIKDILEIIYDQYGKFPDELVNLQKILLSRINIQDLGIKAIKTKTSSIILYFDNNLLSSEPFLRDKVLNFFMQRPKIYKINPDYSINCLFKDKINIDTLLDFTEFLKIKLND